MYRDDGLLCRGILRARRETDSQNTRTPGQLVPVLLALCYSLLPPFFFTCSLSLSLYLSYSNSYLLTLLRSQVRFLCEGKREGQPVCSGDAGVKLELLLGGQWKPVQVHQTNGSKVKAGYLVTNNKSLISLSLSLSLSLCLSLYTYVHACMHACMRACVHTNIRGSFGTS